MSNRRGRKPSVVVTAVILFSIMLFGVQAAFAQPSDIRGHWAEKQITEWVDKGLAAGYLDGKFKPDNRITRSEFVALVNRAFEKEDPEAEAHFSDVTVRLVL